MRKKLSVTKMKNKYIHGNRRSKEKKWTENDKGTEEIKTKWSVKILSGYNQEVKK